jgi:hypothetical protein
VKKFLATRGHERLGEPATADDEEEPEEVGRGQAPCLAETRMRTRGGGDAHRWVTFEGEARESGGGVRGVGELGLGLQG